jgi:hypothetical protein
MVHADVQLTEEQMNQLKDLAIERQVSISELIQQGVDHVLQEAALSGQMTQRERAIAAAGRYASGLPDLGTNHDKYFIESVVGGE